jgi:cbb3-type cytochrome oxidase maturation protein
MTIILFLLVVSLTIGAGGLAFFLWSLRSGQYDDLDGAASRILFDDDSAPPPAKPVAPRSMTGSGRPPSDLRPQVRTGRSGKARSWRDRHSGLT